MILINRNILIVTFILCFLADISAQSSSPREPSAPVAPIVPGADQNRRINEFPVPPPIPGRNQNEGPVRVIDSYELNILGSYPNGNTANNTANTINNAQYTLYSNGNKEIKLIFNDGTEYVYHLRNPRSRIEINNGLFRETLDVLVQVGSQFLLDQYSCELSYNENTITSFNLIGNNRVVVILNVRKKQ